MVRDEARRMLLNSGGLGAAAVIAPIWIASIACWGAPLLFKLGPWQPAVRLPFGREGVTGDLARSAI